MPAVDAPVIIQVGLPWDYPKFESEMQAFVRDGLEHGRRIAVEAGYDFRIVDASPELGIEEYADQLAAMTRLDGIIFGFGIRANKDLTPFFEKLIDATRTHAPKAKILFNTSPDSGVDAARRWFPL